MQPTRPITIGLLTPTVAEGNGLLLWQGILEKTQAFGVRLITYTGGELRYPEPFYRQANQVYELADQKRLDGLIIWTSSLSAFIDDEAIRNFCLHFAPVPVVGLGIPLPGVPTVILKSYQGMREAILHLHQVHGKKRLIFVRGPEYHYDARERLRAYLDVVKEYDGLEDDPDLVTPPCRWIERDAIRAMRTMVEERNVQFDGIVAVNDTLAYGAMVYLQEQGYRLPEEIALVGFDNNPIGRVCTPPLTTVPNRMRERGRQAVQMLMKTIAGESVPEAVTLDTTLKVRQSCGCQDPYIVQAGKPAELMQISNPIELRSELFIRLQRAVPSEENVPNWQGTLLNAFEAGLGTQSDLPFLTAMLDLLKPYIQTGVESREWQAALSELRQWLLLQYSDQPSRVEYGERLLHQGRIMIGEVTTRSLAHQEWMRNRRLNDLHRLRLAISACETLEDLLDILANELPRLGITTGCLALYQYAAHPLHAARLVLAFNEQGRLTKLEGKVFMPSARLVPPDLIEHSDLMNLMVHPLHFGSEQLGFLIFDSSAFEGSSHQVLREQISSALKNVMLIEQNMHLYRQARQNQQLAEEANQLKSRFLSVVGHELLTPIVLLVGLSEMMLHEGIGDRPNLPEAYRQDLTRIHASAQQLGSLVRDVLDLSRSQLGQLTLAKKPIEIAELIRPIELVGEQMAISKGLEWEVSLPDNLPRILGDASRLQQVVLNLVSNAVKFTSQGAVRLDVKVENGFVIVAVSDTGVSVPVEEQEAIFDEFHQSERTVARGFGGLGIGLAICRQLIEMHGGKIWVQSSGEENSGSTFFFSLPVLNTPTQAALVEQPQAVAILTEAAQHCAPLLEHLEERGYQVSVIETLHNPAWLNEIHEDVFGALVLDFQDDQEGWKIIGSLKQNPAFQDMPVIFYSLLQEQDRGAILSLDYLSKPVAAANLTQILRRYGLSTDSQDCTQSVLIVDDDTDIREMHARMVQEHFPACQVFTAANGIQALEIMRSTPPALVLLDLRMPEMDGMAVLKAMQAEKTLQGIPVIVLTAQHLSEREMANINQSVAAVLAKGVFSSAETLAHIEQALRRQPRLGSDNQRLVRKVMAYIHEHFSQPINRKQLADYAGVSERHLNRCFAQELGLTPLNYLNRYRIQQAKTLLEKNHLSILEVMGRVGFSESSHFAHVFHREVGLSPSAYKRGKRLSEK